MRSMWNGEISFGLVTIPAKLYTATKDLTPHFHQLHVECGSRINMVRRCPRCARDVEYAEIGKGYEVSKGEYALFTKEELKELDGGDEGGGIEIVSFIELKDVDLVYIGKSYWIGPGGKNSRGFGLLHQALIDTKRVALAKVRIRSKQQLGIVRPRGKLFSLETIRFADEIVSGEEIDLPEGRATTDKELELAIDLVNRLAADFEPGLHPNEYRAAVEAAVQEKVDAKELKVQPEEAVSVGQGGKVIDLAELLSRTLKAVPKPGVKKAQGASEKAEADKPEKKSPKKKATG